MIDFNDTSPPLANASCNVVLYAPLANATSPPLSSSSIYTLPCSRTKTILITSTISNCIKVGKAQTVAMAGGENQVKVLSLWASLFGMRVPIALEEKGVQYQYQEEVLSNKSQFLLQMNPVYKKIPVLIHNGKPVCESLIILQYIDETWPHHPLLPSHPYARAQVRFWADFVDKKLLESVIGIVRTKGETQEEAKRDLLGCLDLLEGAFGEGPYFGGQEFGFMDIALIPYTSWFRPAELIGNFKIPMDTRFPWLKIWIEKCMERESVKKILPPPDKILEYVTEARKRFVTD